MIQVFVLNKGGVTVRVNQSILGTEIHGFIGKSLIKSLNYKGKDYRGEAYKLAQYIGQYVEPNIE